MPTVSRMAPITVKGSDWPLTIGWRRQTSSTSNLIPAANPEPDCRRSRGWGKDYKPCRANRMAAQVHLTKMASLIRAMQILILLSCSVERFLVCPLKWPSDIVCLENPWAVFSCPGSSIPTLGGHCHLHQCHFGIWTQRVTTET